MEEVTITVGGGTVTEPIVVGVTPSLATFRLKSFSVNMAAPSPDLAVTVKAPEKGE